MKERIKSLSKLCIISMWYLWRKVNNLESKNGLNFLWPCYMISRWEMNSVYVEMRNYGVCSWWNSMSFYCCFKMKAIFCVHPVLFRLADSKIPLSIYLKYTNLRLWLRCVGKLNHWKIWTLLIAIFACRLFLFCILYFKFATVRFILNDDCCKIWLFGFSFWANNAVSSFRSFQPCIYRFSWE